jgi:hypothetical protein
VRRRVGGRPRSTQEPPVIFGLTYEGQLWAYRVIVWVLPVVVYIVTHRVCRELRQGEIVELARRHAEREARHAHRAPVGG